MLIKNHKLFFLLFILLYLLSSNLAKAHFSSIPNENTWVTNGQVNAIVKDEINGIVYIGGDFTHVGPNTGSGAPLDITTGQPQFPFPKVNGTIHIVIPDGSGGWYIGGSFTQVGKVARNNIAHILSDGSVDSNWNPNANSTVYTLALSGSTIYVGGEFTSIGGQTRNRIAALDATTGQATSWDPDADDFVWTLALSGSTIYVGGQFTSIGGETQPYFAQFNTPGITVYPTSGLVTTESGGTATFTVVLNTQPTANVTINLSSSDPTEGTVSPTSLTFTPSNWNIPQTVTITGVDDPVVDGNIAYTINLYSSSTDSDYNGLTYTVSVTNNDNDTNPPLYAGGSGSSQSQSQSFLQNKQQIEKQKIEKEQIEKEQIEKLISLITQILIKQQEEQRKFIKSKPTLKEKLQKHPLKNELKNFRFKKVLKEGMRDKDIKYLQIILNLDNDTKIRDKGLGSFKNETEYFGYFTKQAVIKFQEKYKGDILKPINKDKGTGIVGIMTIMKLNEILDEITR